VLAQRPDFFLLSAQKRTPKYTRIVVQEALRIAAVVGMPDEQWQRFIKAEKAVAVSEQ